MGLGLALQWRNPISMLAVAESCVLVLIRYVEVAY